MKTEADAGLLARDRTVELERAAEILASAEHVALTGHLNPDPDALGSMLGLASFLLARDTDVICSWPNEPLEMPRWLGLFAGLPPIVPISAFPKEPTVMVALDTASPDRLGALVANAERAGVLIVLDHHASNPGFGDVLVLDPGASSTAEVAYRLMCRIGGSIPDDAAALLYAGLVTDTGRFQYPLVTPDTLRVAAELRSRSFDHAALARALYEDSSLPALKLAGRALGRLELLRDADLVWTHITQADLKEVGAQLVETDDLIDTIRLAREADVACLIKEQRDRKLKASLRSRGGTDVGAVAVALGGGGHRLAAGYASRLDLQGTVATLVRTLAEVRGASA